MKKGKPRYNLSFLLFIQHSLFPLLVIPTTFTCNNTTFFISKYW